MRRRRNGYIGYDVPIKLGFERNGPINFVVYGPGMRAARRRDLETPGNEENAERILEFYKEALRIKVLTKVRPVLQRSGLEKEATPQIEESIDKVVNSYSPI